MTNPSIENLEENIRKIMQSVEPEEKFVDSLWEEISQTSLKQKAPFSFGYLFTKPAWNISMAVILVILFVAVIGPQNVVAAFNNLLSYIPGIGFIQDENGARYLSEPIIVEKNGIKLVIDQAVTDASNTVIAYHFENLPKNAEGEAETCFYDNNELLLSDGKTRLPIGGWVQGTTARVEFQPLAGTDKSASLYISQNMPEPDCTGPSEWVVDITFGPIPPTVTLMPVIPGDQTMISTATPQGQASSRPQGQTPPTDPIFHLSIDKAVALTDGYLITGNITWENKDWMDARIDFESLRVVDTNGNLLDLEPSPDEWKDDQFAYKIIAYKPANPLTMQVSAIYVGGMGDESTSFSFDAGEHPTIGQKWELNKEIKIAGQTIHIDSVEAVQFKPELEGQNPDEGYAFKISGSPEFQSVDFLCRDQGKAGNGYGQARKLDDSHTLVEEYFSEGRPVGGVHCMVNNYQFRLKGDWKFQYQLP
ncbi:MAG: DUF4179 domain-containing protein [Leptolinea sp.]|jgi:hypothetical protein|nr:DUF4179 domain-containing protein [Leptolinea sp.]